jgi:hypothetical protein
VDRLCRIDHGRASPGSCTRNCGNALECAKHPLPLRLGCDGSLLQVLNKCLSCIQLLGWKLAIHLFDGGSEGLDKHAQVTAVLGDGDIALLGAVALPTGDVAGRALHMHRIVGHDGCLLVDRVW